MAFQMYVHIYILKYTQCCQEFRGIKIESNLKKKDSLMYKATSIKSVVKEEHFVHLTGNYVERSWK